MLQSIIINNNKYSIKPLAAGGFVDIYRGTNNQDPSDVKLVKVFKKKYLDNETIVARFEEEFRILHVLGEESQFFAKQAHFGRVDNRRFVSYTFIEGVTVLQLLKDWTEDRFTPLHCCALMTQILGALNVLHDRDAPIVHSDLSPENLIVSDDKVFLIDMGCAQELNRPVPKATHWVGKPSYLSPEQARGKAWQVQSDIFQAGIVFYELLTGKRWNKGASPEEKKSIACNPPPTDFTHLPVEVRPILRSMLKTEVNHRIYSTSLCLRRLEYARRALQRRVA